jgi:hypothetical protein
MPVYQSGLFIPSEATLVGPGDDADSALAQPFIADPTIRTTPSNGRLSVCTTDTATEASTTGETTSTHSPSNLAPDRARRARSPSLKETFRSFSRSPSRSRNGLIAVRPKETISAVLAPSQEAARVKLPKLGKINDEMLALLNEVLKGKGDEFKNIPLGEKHVVSVQSICLFQRGVTVSC